MERTIKKCLFITVYIDKRKRRVEVGWVEIQFLLKKELAYKLELYIDHLDRDMWLFSGHGIITASLEATLLWPEKWNMPDYSFFARKFNVIQSYIALKTTDMFNYW